MNSAALKLRMRAWGRRQLYSFFSSLGTLLSHRFGTLMTVVVLGIAMVLPIGLLLTLENLRHIDLHQDKWGTLTVFLNNDVTEEQVRTFEKLLQEQPVERSNAISPQQGLEEFREASGFGNSLDVLDSNPLPWIIEVEPRWSEDQPIDGQVESLAAWLESHEWVESVVVDSKWLQRLAGLIRLGDAFVSVLGFMFSLAVMVVVANTIRLDVGNRADEIEILSLVGAGPGFIRLPFLYTGFWYGVLGAFLALILLELCLAYLRAPLANLMDAYGNSFSLAGLSIPQVFGMFVAGGTLGWLGAWIAVQRYLRLLNKEGLFHRF
ncbi:MAG TPA: permease-like cell division protein FtsX [Xanthomonadales bacterium]|nr:permease-like cell division protein FtsX [Xanthomonadales bacterium]